MKEKIIQSVKEKIISILNAKLSEKVEGKVFLFLLILNILPVIGFKYFPTLDGPAHLYNANLIRQLMLDGTVTLKQFYQFNSEIIPNWTAHFILSMSGFVLPPFLAEKVVTLFIIAGLPLAFRKLIKTIAPENILLSYMIFPFSYSFFTFLGFQNFLIAVVLMFYGLAFWFKNKENLLSVKNWLILFFLFMLIWFSHVFVFGITIFIFGIDTLFSLKKLKLPVFFKKVLFLISATLLPIGGLLFYFYNRSDFHPKYLEASLLLENIFSVGILRVFVVSTESPYTQTIGIVFLVLMLAILINVVKQKISLSGIKDYLRSNSGTFLIITLCLLALVFIVPDSDGYAGYVSLRLIFLFFLFLIVWISLHQMFNGLKTIGVVVVIVAHLSLNVYYMDKIASFNSYIADIEFLSQKIEEDKIVWPVNFFDNWFLIHFSNYLGIEKPVTIMENYEAGTGYFPIVWNKKNAPEVVLMNFSESDCISSWKISNSKTVETDYVFVQGSARSYCDSVIIAHIEKNYDLIELRNNYSLYKAKN
jgi:hypothetical protein